MATTRTMRGRRLLALGLLVWALAACSAGSDDDDDAAAPSGDDDNDNDSGADDDGTGDDDVTPPNATVFVHNPPDGNPLARLIEVTTDQPCSLTGVVWKAGEPGVAPSDPAATADGLTHRLWFYGLLAESAFNYEIRLAGEDGSVVAAGQFETPALPWWLPAPAEFVTTAGAAENIWVAVMMNNIDVAWEFLGDVRASWTIIYDRQGRPRFFHEVNDFDGLSRSNLLEGLRLLPDGRLAWSNRRHIVAAAPNGDEYVLYPVQLNEPYLTPTHHLFQYLDDDQQRALVLFNEVGAGVNCFHLPIDGAVADGAALLDAEGRELWRWSLLDHADQIPPTEVNPCTCESQFWGLGTQDFSHANSVYTMDEGRSLLMSLRNIRRVVKIDVATGRIIWQLGKGLDFQWVGTEPADERWFYDQHDAQPLPNGHILMFDNSNGRYGPCMTADWSRALELELDEQNMTVRQVWEHRVLFAVAMGEVVRMPGGNTFISGGWSGRLTEVTPAGEEVWVMGWDVAGMLPNLAGGVPIQATWDYESAF